MSIPYRTRRVLNRLGIVLMIFLLVGVIAWLCWVVWLERYVVYTADGASLDFEHSAQDIIGEVATPPVAQQNISIYYNEGSDALDTGNELTQINGYYISSNMLQNDINGVLGKLYLTPGDDVYILYGVDGMPLAFRVKAKLKEKLLAKGGQAQ